MPSNSTKHFSGTNKIMLVLSRTKGQEILIPDFGITIKVVDVRGHNIKIGLDAPRNISIVRKELVDADKTSPTETSDPSDRQPHRDSSVPAAIDSSVPARPVRTWDKHFKKGDPR
jgi:carbon storage regulator